VGASSGNFKASFTTASDGSVPGRIDYHQSGAGFGGHLWFTHTRNEIRNGVDLYATGTWTFTTAVNSWGRVLVHMPNYAAHTQQAAYVIDNGAGSKTTRYALQRRDINGWISLGAVKFSGYPKIQLSSKTLDGTGDDDIAWDAVAIQKLPAKPKQFVVALGDSYSSGEGASPFTGDFYDYPTDHPGLSDDGRDKNGCHRSTAAWPRKLTLMGNTATLAQREASWDPTLDFQFHACSGAETQNVNDGGAGPNAFGINVAGQFGEVSQISKGYLTSNTTLVTLSIGGNDTGFESILVSCYLLPNCESANDGYVKTMQDKTDPSIRQTLDRIHVNAPNAKIVLVGYPELFSNADCLSAVGIDGEEASSIDGLVAKARDMFESIASDFRNKGISVAFADPISDFYEHGICSASPYINGLVGTFSRSESFSLTAPFSQQSYHPNTDGTTAYASAVQKTLRLLGL
jgi:lysophospholipase L1-like esterase